MSNASNTAARVRARGRSAGPSALLVLAVYTPLALYLFRATEHTGDGAAYTLQVSAGVALDRAVHAGWLAPLTAWTQLLDLFGVPAAGATNAASALAMGLGLLGLERLGRELARETGGRATDGLLAPATALCSVAVWDAATFCEVYGPLSATCIGAVLALRSGRSVVAGIAAFAALAVHPGALALLPGLLILGTPPGRNLRPAFEAVVVTTVLATAWVLLLGPSSWLGPRGLLAPGADVLAPQALQRAWRLLARDLGISALPLLVGGLLAWTRRDARGLRWLMGCGLLLLGTVLGLDRFSDNPANLPLFLLCTPLAALAPAALRAFPPRAARAGSFLVVAVLVLGIAEATTRQDAVARSASKAAEARQLECDSPGPAGVPWRERMLSELACAAR
ncbi:MAG: hypothetical protein KDA24_18180 [Deltaproteobacteria bacterium]|nr:hypothetical protein [Deltaproteobacteria bacterium]